VSEFMGNLVLGEGLSVFARTAKFPVALSRKPPH